MYITDILRERYSYLSRWSFALIERFAFPESECCKTTKYQSLLLQHPMHQCFASSMALKYHVCARWIPWRRDGKKYHVLNSGMKIQNNEIHVNFYSDDSRLFLSLWSRLSTVHLSKYYRPSIENSKVIVSLLKNKKISFFRHAHELAGTIFFLRIRCKQETESAYPKE